MASDTEAAPNILFRANDIIYGDREKTYGNPAKNLAVIAEFWTTYLHAIGVAENITLTAEDVCVMMVLLKTARLSNSIDHVDSQIDSCGYMALLERVQDWKKLNAACDKVPSLKDAGEVAVKTTERKEEENATNSLVKCTAIPMTSCSYPSCSCVQKLVSQLK